MVQCSCPARHAPTCPMYGVTKKRRRNNGVQSSSKRHRIIRRDDRRCQYCGRKCSQRVKMSDAQFLTIDHIIPVSRGGHRSSEVNQVVCCALCNSLKGDRMPWEIQMWPLNGLGGCWAPKQAPPA